MTVIAWDGKTLAADKQSTSAGLARTVTKLSRSMSADGKTLRLYGISGDPNVGQEIIHWHHNGLDGKDFPSMAKDGGTTVIMVDRSGVYLFDKSAFPERIEDEFVAIGSGRDFALAAMYLGCDARDAVEVACHFQDGCGRGIDTEELVP